MQYAAQGYDNMAPLFLTRLCPSLTKSFQARHPEAGPPTLRTLRYPESREPVTALNQLHVCERKSNL